MLSKLLVLATLAILLPAMKLHAQELPARQAASAAAFSLPAGADAPAIEGAIPDLARQALARIPPGDEVARLEQQFRLQLAAGLYEEAAVTFDAWNALRPPLPSGQLADFASRVEMFAKAKAIESREKVPYGDALRKAIEIRFAKLNDRQAADTAHFLGAPPFGVQATLQRQIASLKGRDSITYAELTELVRQYGALKALQSFVPVIATAIQGDEAKRFIVDRGVLIRMRDGATIAADVVRMKNITTPQPAVLNLTIYADVEFLRRDAKEAALRGYVGVWAYSRGKYLSNDEMKPWETEVTDVYDIVDWVSKQPWSNGKVGMVGHSYGGFAQWAGAKNLHPALKSLVPSGSSFPGNGLPFSNNVALTTNIAWGLQVMNSKYDDYGPYGDFNRWARMRAKWYESGRPFREIDAVDGTPNTLLQKQLLHPSYDDYWKAMQPYGEEFARIDIPVLSLTGYYDDAGPAAVNYLVDHYKYNRNADHYLVIGPYPHGGVMAYPKQPVVNGWTLEPSANIDTTSLIYQWFDHTLKGGAKPDLLRDRINYQVLGANRWDHAPSIAKMSNRTLALYPSNAKVGNRYDLSAARPAAAGSVEQVIDFADRETTNNLYPGNAYLSTPDSPGWITYISEPLEEPAVVAGQITGELLVTLNKKDFDFMWALYEAMPDGQYFNISHYLGRASYAKDWSTRQLLTPGKQASIPFRRTQLVARQISKGSRLMLLVTVSRNPFSQINYGTGKDVSDESIADAKEPLRIRWHNGSVFRLPLKVGAEAPTSKSALEVSPPG